MTTIEHRCPKCGKTLYVENVNDYFIPEKGCTVVCNDCDLRLIGVDISCCADCKRPKRKEMKCNKRLFSTIYKDDEVYSPQQDEVIYHEVSG